MFPWIKKVRRFLDQKKFAGITHYPWGGSFIYALIAAGIVAIYVMFDEPTDEIRPARAFVEAAGLTLYSVRKGKVLEPFDWTQEERVDYFVAASSEQVARSFVEGMWQRNSIRGRTLSLLRRARLAW